jgi:hypothetical protein
MSISIALTEEQRRLLMMCIEVARDRFKEDATACKELAELFNQHAADTDALILWFSNAQDILVVERRD